MCFTIYFFATVLIVDLCSTNDKTNIFVRRIGRDKLSIFEKEAISFEVWNKSNRPIKLWLKDEPPEFHFNMEESSMEGTLLPGERKTFTIWWYPQKEEPSPLKICI